MNLKDFLWNNDSARVSFAVLGIFLILGSSVTSVYVSMYDQKYREDQTYENNQQHVETLLAAARLDLSQILNIAGINALQYISSHPIISCSDQFHSAEEVNKYRIKQKIAEALTNYLYCNYEGTDCYHGGLNLRIDFSQLPEKKIPGKKITMTPITMTLHRSFTIPFFGPKRQQEFPVYYKVNCDIPVIITRTNQYDTTSPFKMNLSVSTVLTARYSLLNHLFLSFNESINGLGPLWRTITLLANIYSMARGYRHYQRGTPKNVVDNKHLELITNIGFLFEETLTFSGIDPELLLETILHSSLIFSQNETVNESIVNSREVDEWIVPFSNFQEIGEKHGNENQTRINSQQMINISDIAASILWTYSTIDLYFIDTTGKKHTIIYDVEEELSLEETIQYYMHKGWQLIGSSKEKNGQNYTTQQQLNSLSKSIYKATFYTQVDRRGPENMILGNHTGYLIDNSSSSWTFHKATLQDQQGKPKKGCISLGSTVFEEVYTVIWKRTHTWSNKTIEKENDKSVIHWNERKVTDTKIEHNVSLSIILESYGDMKNTSGEIKDVFYENSTFSDSNLMSTINQYRSTVYKMNKKDLLISPGGMYLTKQIDESVPSWVLTAAFNTLIDIYQQVSTINVSDEINPLRYSNPNSLFTKAYEDVLEKFMNDKSRFVQRKEYVEEGKFQSTGRKAVYSISSWFVNCIEQQLEQLYTKITRNLEKEISNALQIAGIEDQNDFYEATDENIISSFKRQLPIIFSLPMKLEGDSWNESVLLTIDHTPEYCTCFSKEIYEGKKEYFLGIRNSCLLGPSGLPILPISPTTPWIITLNIWLVQIRGSFAEFILYDTSDETVFHPLFCHEPLEYVRKNEVIRSKDGSILGWNKRISYAVDTIASSIVPSGGCMIGDTDGVLVEHHGRRIS